MGTLKTRYEFETAGGEKVRLQLENIGAAGQKAFEKVAQSAARTPAHLKVVSAASQELQGHIQAMSGTLSVLGAAGGGLGLAGLAVGALATGLFGLTKRAIESVGALQDQADQIGLNVETYQALQFSAVSAGVGQDALSSAIATFTKRVGEARQGTGPLVKALKDHDHELLQNIRNAGSMEGALDAYGRKIASLPSPTDAATLAAAGFGKTGGRLVPVLRDLKDGVGDFVQKAKDAGAVVDGSLVKGADAADDALSRLSFVVGTTLKKSLIENAPLIESMAVKLSNLAAAVGRFLSDDLTAVGHAPAVVALTAQIAAEEQELQRLEKIKRETSATLLGFGGVKPELLSRIATQTDKLAALVQQRDAVALEIEKTLKPPKNDDKQPLTDRGTESKAAAARQRAVEELKRLTEEANTAGLEGLSALEAKRDETYAKWAELAKEGKLREAEIADGNLKIWTAFDKDRTKLLQDESEKAAKAQETANEKLARQQEKALEEQRRPWENFFADLQSGFGDVFAAALDDGKITGDELVTTFKKAGLRLISELASLQVQQSLVQPLLSSVFGAPGVVGGAVAPSTVARPAASGGGLGLGSLVSGGSTLSSLADLAGVGGGAGTGSGLLSILNAGGGTSGTVGLGLLGLAALQQNRFKVTPLSGGLLGLSALRTIAPYLADTQLGGTALGALGNGPYAQVLRGVLGISGGTGVVPPAFTGAGSLTYGAPAIGSIDPLTGAVVQPANYVAAPADAASSGGSLAGGISGALAIIGALYSLYSSVSGGIETNAGFRRATLGDSRANQNFTGAQVGFGAAATAVGAGVGVASGIGTGIATGAGIGTAVFPGIGTAIGAIIGAAVGAAVAQAVSQAVAQAVGQGVSAAVKSGLSQDQLRAKVEDGLADSWILKVLGGPISTFDKLGVGFGALNARWFTPDIDDIFDKALSRQIGALTGGAFKPDRRLTTKNQGTTRAQRQQIDPLRDDIEGLADLAALRTGALGGEGGDRLRRYFAIIYNSLAAFGKNTDQAAELIGRAVRAYANGRFFQAVKQDELIGKLFGPHAEAVLRGAQDHAFQTALPGADLVGLRAAFAAMIDGQGKIKRRDRKASLESVQKLLGDALGGGTPDDFLSGLIDAENTAAGGAIGGGLLRGAFGDLLSGANRTIRRESRRARRTGDYGDLTEALGKETQNLTAAFEALRPTLSFFQDQMLKIAVTTKLAAGDTAGANAAIQGRLAPFQSVLTGYKQLARDVRSRSAFALAGPGYVGDAAAVEALGDRVTAARVGLNAASPLLGLLIDNHLGNRLTATERPGVFGAIDFATALPALKEFTDARMAQLEGELALARQLKDAFQGVSTSAEGLLDAIDVSRRGRGAQRAILARDRQRFLEAIGRENTANPSTYAEVIARGQGLLQFAEQAFGARSAQFRGVRNLVEGPVRDIDQFARQEIIAQAAREKAAMADVTAFNQEVRPLLEAAQDAAATKVTNAINELTKLFQGEAGVLALLRAIAAGVPPPTAPTPDPLSYPAQTSLDRYASRRNGKGRAA